MFPVSRPPSQLESYRNAFDVLVAPYRREVQGLGGATNLADWMSPLKIFEYMSRGLPILSSLRGQAKDMLAEAGIGTTYNRPSEFLGAFAALAGRDPEGLAAMGTRARAYFTEHFDENIVYPRYAAHIEKLVAERIEV